MSGRLTHTAHIPWYVDLMTGSFFERLIAKQRLFMAG